MRPLNYQIIFEVEDEHWWFVGRRQIVFTQIEDALSQTPVASRSASEAPSRPGVSAVALPSGTRAARQILDIGCGTGATLDHLKRYGEVQGVDLSEMALNFCHRRGHQRVILGSALELPFADESFDLITALDIIEHLDDDVHSLSEIRRVLKTGAPAVIFVPAFQTLWGPNDDQSHHKRRYRLGQLRSQVEASGLRVERISYANIVMFAPIWVGRKLLNALGATSQAEGLINHPLINKPLARIFSSEARWLRHHTLPFGTSIVCVARKEF